MIVNGQRFTNDEVLEAHSNIERAVSFLTQWRPYWWLDVVVSRLNEDDTKNCVLTQATCEQAFTHAYRKLGLTHDSAKSLGFDVDRRLCPLYTKMWRERVTKLRKGI